MLISGFLLKNSNYYNKVCSTETLSRFPVNIRYTTWLEASRLTPPPPRQSGTLSSKIVLGTTLFVAHKYAVLD